MSQPLKLLVGQRENSLKVGDQKSSIINHQSSIINHQSSIINHQSSIINH